MTTTRHGRIIVFECDICGDSLDTGETEFSESLHVKKQEEWTSRKDEDGDWIDVCSSCKVEMR